MDPGPELLTPQPVQPRVCDLPQVRAMTDQLMGSGNYADGLRPVEEYDNLIVRWPVDEPHREQWQRPVSGHLESYNGAKGGWFGGAMMGATLYLEDVLEAGGGGFYLWPKSHPHIHAYMKRQPLRIQDGSAPGASNENAWNKDKLSQASGMAYGSEPLEWCAKAGDLCIWHHWTVHAPSENFRRSPRLAIIARWHHASWADMKWDAGGITSDGDLWKHWAPEVRAAAAAADTAGKPATNPKL